MQKHLEKDNFEKKIKVKTDRSEWTELKRTQLKKYIKRNSMSKILENDGMRRPANNEGFHLRNPLNR